MMRASLVTTNERLRNRHRAAAPRAARFAGGAEKPATGLRLVPRRLRFVAAAARLVAARLRQATCRRSGLAGQVPTYLAKQIDEFKRGARPHPLPIPALADRLSDASVEALGAYFGKLDP